MDKIIIMHLLSSKRFSGAENVACQIISLFKEKKDINMVYCSPEGPIRDALTERGIQFEPLQSLSIKNLRQAIDLIKPSIIHAHDMKASFMAFIAAPNIRLISHIHNNNFNSRHFSIKSLLYFFSALKASHIFWVSKSSYDGYIFHKWFWKKSSILYNIIDIQALEKKANEDIENKSFDIVFLGRLTFLKDPQRLIRILSSLIYINNTVRIAIIGDGDMREDVLNLIETYSISNNVSYLGFLPNPYGILKNAKCMIMTSRSEGLPMCALEAMSLGVPIVSTPVGGLIELITDGEDGILSNDDQVIVNSLTKLINNEQFQKRLSKAAKQKMKLLLDLDAYSNSLEKVYDNIE